MLEDDFIIPHTGESTSKSAHALVDRAIANNEPVFVMRAKDVHSVRALAAYLDSVRGGGSPPEFVTEIGKLFRAFQEWRKENSHQVKFPD